MNPFFVGVLLKRGSQRSPRAMQPTGLRARYLSMHAQHLHNSLDPATDASPGTNERLRRLRSVAWLMDNSIPLPGGYRIGADALIGLIPGIGDALGALISAYLINEARTMGAPRSVLLRMTGNVMIETVIGAIPFAGDLFDAAFKANMRNLALLERYAVNPVASRRSSRWFVFGFSLLMLLLIVTIIAVPVLVIMGLVQLFS